MSPARQSRALSVEQEVFLTVRSLATTYSSGYVVEPHTHPWRQLLVLPNKMNIVPEAPLRLSLPADTRAMGSTACPRVPGRSRIHSTI
jgi:hypothetical protein